MPAETKRGHAQVISVAIPLLAALASMIGNSEIPERSSARSRLARADRSFEVQLPDLPGVLQDEEYCLLTMHGLTRTLQFHNYGPIFDVSGLCEHLFEHLLHCSSPRLVVSLLTEVMRATEESVTAQRVLAVEAGNGAVSSELRLAGLRHTWGLDRDGSAHNAALRDRPSVYNDYLVADASSLSEVVDTIVEGIAPTCLACTGAIGFDGPPVSAFADVAELLPTGGWPATTLHEYLVDDALNLLVTRGLTLWHWERYQHWLAVDGRPILLRLLNRFGARETGPYGLLEG